MEKEQLAVLVYSRNSLSALQKAINKEITTKKNSGYSLSSTPIIPTQLTEIDDSTYLSACLVFER